MKEIVTKNIDIFLIYLYNYQSKGYEIDVDISTSNGRSILLYNEVEDTMCKLILNRPNHKKNEVAKVCPKCENAYFGKTKTCPDCEFITKYNATKKN